MNDYCKIAIYLKFTFYCLHFISSYAVFIYYVWMHCCTLIINVIVYCNTDTVVYRASIADGTSLLWTLGGQEIALCSLFQSTLPGRVDQPQQIFSR